MSSSNHNRETNFSIVGKAFHIQSEISCREESVSSQRVHIVVSASSIFIRRSLWSFHKFTPVFLQISYKQLTMAESSSRCYRFRKLLKEQEQQNKKT